MLNFTTFNSKSGKTDLRKAGPQSKINKNFINEVYTTETKLSLKEQHRLRCSSLINLIKDINFKKQSDYIVGETVLIEFRIMEHLEFLVLNICRLLPNWQHTIVCGLINKEFIEQIVNTIKSLNNYNIKIIVKPYSNMDQNSYSSMLLTKEFWSIFEYEKILIYQEDTLCFHNNIEQYMSYDYIGAPFPEGQMENIKGVGNGGFSLRSKSKMLMCLSELEPSSLEINEHVQNLIKSWKLDYPPEDVYFSKTLIDKNLGTVATIPIAKKFSQETVLGNNPLGGHCYWLAKKNRIIPGFIKNKIAIISHYDYTIGGGEKYLSDIINFLGKTNCEIHFYNMTPEDIFWQTAHKLICKDVIDNLRFYRRQPRYTSDITYDLCIEMINVKESNFLRSRIAHSQWLHCQFPLDFKIPFKNINKFKNLYDRIIVNSDFTKNIYQSSVPDDFNIPIDILYPLCYHNNDDYGDGKFCTDYNTIKFVSIGRIFSYHPSANNKKFDEIIKVFNLFVFQYPTTTFELHLVGTVIHEEWYKYLKFLASDNKKLYIHPDLSNKDKNKLLDEADYYIHSTGFLENELLHPYRFEHFGISLIEAIHRNCIPIIMKGGYPSYYIKNNVNGYVFQTIEQLFNIFKKINDKKINNYDDMIKNNKIIIKNYSEKKYKKRLLDLIINNRGVY